MTQEQFEEIIFYIDQIQRNRERSRQAYHKRKEKQVNPKRHQTFPIISQQEQYQQYVHRQLQPIPPMNMQLPPVNTKLPLPPVPVNTNLQQSPVNTNLQLPPVNTSVQSTPNTIIK